MQITKWEESQILKNAAESNNNTEVLEKNKEIIDDLKEKNQTVDELLHKSEAIKDSMEKIDKNDRTQTLQLLGSVIDLLGEYVQASIQFLDSMYDYLDKSESFAMSMFDYPEDVKNAIAKEAELRENALNEVVGKLSKSAKTVSSFIMKWCKLAMPNLTEEQQTLPLLQEHLSFLAESNVDDMFDSSILQRLQEDVELIALNKQLLGIHNP